MQTPHAEPANLGAEIRATIALALPQASILARVMRSALLDTLGEDYIRSARAKARRTSGSRVGTSCSH